MTEVNRDEGEQDRLPLAFEIRLAATSLSRQLARSRPADSELTGSQVSILACLFREGELLVGQIAHLEAMRPQSMTQALNKLEHKGFISRRTDRVDGRRVHVSLTDLGRQRLLEDRQRREEWLARRLATLGQEDIDALKAAAPVLRTLGGI